MNTFTEDIYQPGDAVVIYGAYACGEIIYNTLQNLNIPVCAFCDRKATSIKEFCGIPVIEPESLITDFKDAHILVATSSGLCEIERFLSVNNCVHYYSVLELLKKSHFANMNNHTSSKAQDLIGFINNYKNQLDSIEHKHLNITNLFYIVTEKCSLRCKSCAGLQHLYESANNFNFEAHYKQLDNFLQHINALSKLSFTGGECLLNPELDKYIEYFANDPKVQNIEVSTNGTLIPDEKLLTVLRNSKVTVNISGYDVADAKRARIVKILENNGIKFFVNELNYWYKLGEFEQKHKTIEAKIVTYNNCVQNGCYTFLKGRLYHCFLAANLYNTKTIPYNTSDCLDFNDLYSNKDRSQEISEYIYRTKYMEACEYCDGLSPLCDKIVPGQQIYMEKS